LRQRPYQRQTCEEERKLAGLIEQNPGVFFPLFFAAIWLTVTTILAVFSGWFKLME
jgi:hypothetical protein